MTIKEIMRKVNQLVREEISEGKSESEYWTKEMADSTRRDICDELIDEITTLRNL